MTAKRAPKAISHQDIDPAVVLMHLVNHGTQHRSEAATILTDLGQSPGNIDLLVFVLG